MKKPSVKRAYDEMNIEAAEVFVGEHGIDVVSMNGVAEYLYMLEMPDGVDETELMEAANELFHRVCVLEEDRMLSLNEETDYCTVHRDEPSGRCFVLFNHPFVIDAENSGTKVSDTAMDFCEAMRGPIDDDAAGMQRLATDIKSGRVVSKSGEGYFVLKGEFFDAIKAGRKTTEYRDITPRNLSKSIGIKTVKLQRGYGHPGQPPEQMRFEVKSVGLLDADDRECDPYNIPDGFLATTIAIHLGRRIG